MNQKKITMTSHSDKHYRTLHEVEVIYLKNGMYAGRKFTSYPVEEAATIYQRTLNKFRELKNAIVIRRDENNNMISNERF